MRKLALLLFVLLSSGCPKTKLVSVLPPGVRVDSYAQQAAQKIDVLWVIDNSGSMAVRQQNLAKNLQAFMDVFSKSTIDYRIAVTTTDIFKDKGAFFGTPKILTPTTANVVTAFANNVTVGTNGSPYEAGIEGASLALANQTAANAPHAAANAACQTGCLTNADVNACNSACDTTNMVEFLRPDAYLYIIFVSDEDDQSSEDVRYYWRTFEDVKGIGNDGTVTTAAIMGDVPTNTCGATPGVRYQALSSLTGGVVGSICDASFADTLTKLANNAIGLKRTFALADKPDVTTLKVTIDYPCDLPDTQLSTCTSVDNTACADDMDQTALDQICTPPQGMDDGWSYDADNNDIFFAGDSVPNVKGQIQIQYCADGQTCGT